MMGTMLVVAAISTELMPITTDKPFRIHFIRFKPLEVHYSKLLE